MFSFPGMIPDFRSEKFSGTSDEFRQLTLPRGSIITGCSWNASSGGWDCHIYFQHQSTQSYDHPTLDYLVPSSTKYTDSKLYPPVLLLDGKMTIYWNYTASSGSRLLRYTLFFLRPKS